MSLRSRILVYLGALHVLMAVLAFELVRDNGIWLFAFETVFVLSFFVAWKLVRGFFVPLELIRTGAELIREGDFTSRFQPMDQPEMDQLIAVYNKMIDQLRDERLRLREQNELFDKIVDATPGGILICDLDGGIDQLNPSAERLLGASPAELAGHPLAALPGPLGTVLGGLEVGGSRVVPMADGRRVRCQRAEFRDRGFARAFYLLEELTEELRRSEKAAYEKLIRLVSHEVNNSVASVSSLLTTVRAYDLSFEGGERQDFDRALDVATDRMEHLGAFINSFADVVRLPAPERHRHDLGDWLDDLATLIGPWLEERQIRLVRDFRDLPRQVEIDKNQMEQVLLNVLKNAAEAIGDSGTITLRTGGEERRPWIEIEDTGPGLGAAEGELFTPFFTTKADGCGLGLMVVKEVLTRHGFGFSLTHAEAGGAVFRIALYPPALERSKAR